MKDLTLKTTFNAVEYKEPILTIAQMNVKMNDNFEERCS